MKYRLLLPLLFLAGCKVGEDYHAPELALPKSWHEAKTVDTQPVRQLQWWKNFNDPVLDSLITKALAQNIDLQIAASRIKQARAVTSSAKADFLPVIDTETNAIREGNRLAFGNAPFDLTKPFNSYEAGFDASWELDLFGGKRRALESVRALFAATQSDQDNARVSLLAEVGRAYFNIRLYQQQILLTEDIIRTEQETVRIANDLYVSGKSPRLDVIRAQSLETATESQLPGYRNLLAQNEYALDVLLAENPGSVHPLVEKPQPVTMASRDIILNAPAEIIASRPDIRAAQQRFAASVAEIGVSRAKLFPDVSISGFFGLLSPDTSTLLHAASKSWDVGGKINLPILNYPRISADIKLKKAQSEEALLTYRKAVLTALADVESALSAYTRQEETRILLEKTVSGNQQAANIAREQYKAGITAFIDVLEAERTLFDSQKQLADANGLTAQNFIAVYKALGGGWQLPPTK